MRFAIHNSEFPGWILDLSNFNCSPGSAEALLPHTRAPLRNPMRMAHRQKTRHARIVIGFSCNMSRNSPRAVAGKPFDLEGEFAGELQHTRTIRLRGDRAEGRRVIHCTARKAPQMGWLNVLKTSSRTREIVLFMKGKGTRGIRPSRTACFHPPSWCCGPTRQACTAPAWRTLPY